MKKTLYLLGAILISAALFFTACSTDEEDPDLPPSISFVSGDGYLTDDATLTVGEEFKVKVLCEANATSGSKISSLKITRISNNQILWDTTLSYNDATFTLDATFNALPDPGVERIEFKATDKDGQSAMIDLQITTEEASGGPIDSFTMRVLGSYQSTTGSSFASINGEVYTLAEAFNNQAVIDLLYWYGSTTLATIGAPDDDKANEVYTGVNGLPNWSVKNATRFKTTTLSAAEFDAVTDATPCIDNATGADQTRIGELEVGDVFAFLAVTGKHGLIKVVSINTGAAGDITIDVKVEK